MIAIYCWQGTIVTITALLYCFQGIVTIAVILYCFKGIILAIMAILFGMHYCNYNSYTILFAICVKLLIN